MSTLKTPGPKSSKSKALSLDLSRNQIFMSSSYRKRMAEPATTTDIQRFRISNRVYHKSQIKISRFDSSPFTQRGKVLSSSLVKLNKPDLKSNLLNEQDIIGKLRIRKKKGKLARKREAEIQNRGIPRTELKPNFPKVLNFITYYRHLVDISCTEEDLPISIDSGLKGKTKFEFFVNVNEAEASPTKYICYDESNNLVLDKSSLKLNNPSALRQFKRLSLLIVGRLSKKVLFSATCNCKILEVLICQM